MLSPDDDELAAAGERFLMHALAWLGVLAVAALLGLAWLLPHLHRAAGAG